MQGRDHLEKLLGHLHQQQLLEEKRLEKRVPVLVKLAPDLTTEELDDALEAVVRSGLDGVIPTNTTLERPGLHSALQSEAGGLSGSPLRARSEEVLRHAVRRLEGRLPVISAGGISVGDTTLRDETINFVKRLTTAVGNCPKTALVLSLQSSKRESLEYINLLQTLDHLAARKVPVILIQHIANSRLGITPFFNEGTNKLTVVADAPLSAFAGWVEQIVAESSGKLGRGILPVPLEPLDSPEVYGADRLFVYLRKTGEHDEAGAKLQAAGQPVIQFPITDFYAIGAEMFRWEIATVVACSILGVNAFDQPNVESSKKLTKAKIAEYHKKGKLKEGKPAWKKDGVSVFAPSAVTGASLAAVLNKFLKKAKSGGYVAINAYLPRNAEMIDALQKMRVAIRAKTGNAATAGFAGNMTIGSGSITLKSLTLEGATKPNNSSVEYNGKFTFIAGP